MFRLNKVIFPSLLLLYASGIATFDSGMNRLIKPSIEIDLFCPIDLQQNIQTNCFVRFDPSRKKPHQALIDDFDKHQTFTFQNTGESDLFIVQFNCSAPYPVEWSHLQIDKWLRSTFDNWMYQFGTQQVSYHRKVTDFQNTSSYSYSALLVLRYHERDVGQFVCQRAESAHEFENSQISTTIRVFRELNEYDSAFPMAGKNITIWMKQSGGAGSIILPCNVYNPSINVTLYKKIVNSSLVTTIKNPISGLTSHHRKLNTHFIPSKVTVKENWQVISLNERLSFLPEAGFIYNPNLATTNAFGDAPFQLSPGTYKCAISKGDDEGDKSYESNLGDVVIITVQEGEEPPPPQINNEIIPPANLTFKMDEKFHNVQVSCCSMSSNPPTMYLLSCWNKDHCEKQLANLRYLTKQMNTAGENRNSRIVGNCRKSKSINSGLSLNVRCFGDGINVAQTAFFPIPEGNREKNQSRYNLYMQPYLRWDSVDPNKMIRFIPIGKRVIYVNGTKLLVYDEESVKLSCTTSLSYFAEGSFITVKSTNGSVIQFPEKARIKLAQFFSAGIIATIKMEKMVESMSCHAPHLYSDKWTTKTVMFHVEDGQPATINNSLDTEEVVWCLNDVNLTLSCDFSGVPSPVKVYWVKDNKTIHATPALKKGESEVESNYYIYSTISNSDEKNKTVLLVSRVTYEVHGEYNCVVQNIFANATKTFRVYVRPSEKGWIIFTAALGITTFLAILAFFGYRTWRNKIVAAGIIKRPGLPRGGGDFVRF